MDFCHKNKNDNLIWFLKPAIDHENDEFKIDKSWQVVINYLTTCAIFKSKYIHTVFKNENHNGSFVQMKGCFALKK